MFMLKFISNVTISKNIEKIDNVCEDHTKQHKVINQFLQIFLRSTDLFFMKKVFKTH